MPGINAADFHASDCCAEFVLSRSSFKRSLISSRMPVAMSRAELFITRKAFTTMSRVPSAAPLRIVCFKFFDIVASRLSCAEMPASWGSAESTFKLCSSAP